MKNTNTLHNAAVYVSLATDRLRFFTAYHMTAATQAALSEFWATNATSAQCRDKLAAIQAYLSEHPETAAKMNTIADGNGNTGSAYMNMAAAILDQLAEKA